MNDNVESGKEADELAAANGIGENNTIVGLFTQQEKEALLKMMKHHQFNQVESAVLKYLMSEAANFDDLAVMIGAHSTRSKGAPVSKVAAKKELDRILNVVRKRAKLKLGLNVDFSRIKEVKKQDKEKKAERKRKIKEYQKRSREAYKEFWKALAELKKTQREHGLPVSHYEKVFKTDTSKHGSYDENPKRED